MIHRFSYQLCMLPWYHSRGPASFFETGVGSLCCFPSSKFIVLFLCQMFPIRNVMLQNRHICIHLLSQRIGRPVTIWFSLVRPSLIAHWMLVECELTGQDLQKAWASQRPLQSPSPVPFTGPSSQWFVCPSMSTWPTWSRTRFWNFKRWDIIYI